MFSRCINLEYKHHGIDIQCQVIQLFHIPFYQCQWATKMTLLLLIFCEPPGTTFVATKMTKFKKSLFLIASPEMYAKASIRCIGYEHLSMPLCSHSVQRFIVDALPNALLDWCTYHFFLRLRRKRLEKESLRAKGRAAAQTY